MTTLLVVAANYLDAAAAISGRHGPPFRTFGVIQRTPAGDR